MACCSARSIRLTKLNTAKATAKAKQMAGKGQTPKGKKPSGKKASPTKATPCQACGKPKAPKNVTVPPLPPLPRFPKKKR